MTADEQGPDTAECCDTGECMSDADLAEIVRVYDSGQYQIVTSRWVVALVEAVRAARTERDTALAERDTLKGTLRAEEMRVEELDDRVFDLRESLAEEAEAHRHSAAGRARAEAAVVTARRDALLSAAEELNQSAYEPWKPAAVRWLRARASTQTPAAPAERPRDIPPGAWEWRCDRCEYIARAWTCGEVQSLVHWHDRECEGLQRSAGGTDD